MADQRDVLSVDGQAPSLEAVNIAMNEGGLAGDRVLAQLLQLVPFTGSAYTKAIVPYSPQAGSGNPSPSFGVYSPIVMLTNSSKTVTIQPFTAIVGSRTQASGSSSDPVNTTGAILNWRDLRSAVQVGSGALGYNIPAADFEANVTGNPRWDLVFAVLQVEQVTNTSAFVKPTSANTGAQATVAGTYSASVFIAVQPGVASSTPASPLTLLAPDNPASGEYYIPIAGVLIPGTFTSGTTALSSQRIDIIAPIVPISQAVTGALSLAPASSTTGTAMLTATTAPFAGNTWGTQGARPQVALPASMVGGASRFLLFDGRFAAGSSYSFDNASVIDNSIDWRRRYFRTKVQTRYNELFASDASATAGALTPNAGVETSTVTIAQPLVVSSNNAAVSTDGAQPGGYTGFSFNGGHASGSVYYLQLTDLPNGATLQSVTIVVSAGTTNGASTIQLVAATAGGETLLGTAVSPTAATYTSTVPFTQPAVALTHVINTSVYAYYVKISTGSDTGGLTWSFATVTVVMPVPCHVESEGQSFHDDSAFLLGSSEIGSGVGFVTLVGPSQLPKMATGSAFGLYVPITGTNAGALCAYYVGTPGTRFFVWLDATAPYDNL